MNQQHNQREHAMIAWGLLRRYCRLVMSYGLQASVLLLIPTVISLNILRAMLGLSPLTLAEIPWVYLNLLAGLGPITGIALQRYFHPEDHFLHLNHSLSWYLRFPPAILAIWLLAGCGSLGLRLQDDRIQVLVKQGQHQTQEALNLSLNWLQQHPWVQMAGLGLGALLMLLWLVFKLSGHEHIDSEELDHWELAIDSVSHAFGSRQVLKGAWLKCRSGDLIGLLGRNGSGKSTLLQILFGSRKADFRALFLNEVPVNRLFRLPGLIAYLPQTSFLPRTMRVDKAIRLFAGPAALKKLSQEPRLQELLHSRINRLSGGERRLLELGVILALQRPFVLLDEPFSELEPLYKQQVREWIRQAAANGSGLVVTDHDYQEILKISRQVVLMHGGQTRPVDNLKDLDRLYLPI